jgi:hypothetical protein
MNTPPDIAPEQPEQEQPEQEQPPTPAQTQTQTQTPPVQPAPILPAQSSEDTDVGWGDYAERDDNDRLLRDRPPHWDNA